MRKFLSFLILLLVNTSAFAVTYYNKAGGSGSLQVLSNWGTNTDGTGTTPGSFTGASDVFNLYNNTAATITAAWTLGSSVTLNVGNGSSALNFTIPSSFALGTSGTVNVNANATLTIQNATVPSLGTMAATSTVDFAGTAAHSIPVESWGNLIQSSSGTGTMGIGTHTISGSLTVSGGTLSGLSTVTINLFGHLLVSGSGSIQNILGFTHIRFSNTSSSLSVPQIISYTSASAGTRVDYQVLANVFVQLNSNFPLASSPSPVSSVSGHLICQSFTVGGTGGFTLNTGGTIYTTNSGGVTGAFTTSGTKTFSTSGHYVFNGSSSQSTGTLLPISLNGTVTINNSGGVSITNNPTTFNSGSSLRLQDGLLSHTTASLRMNSGSNLQRDNGALSVTPTTYTGVNLSYVNLGPNTTAVSSGNELPISLNGTVTVNKPGAAITTVGAKTITGSLILTSGNMNAGGTISVSSTLSTASGTILNMQSNQLLGSFTPANNGTVQTASTATPAIPNAKTWAGTVIYNNTTGLQSIASGTYNNLTLTNTSNASTAQGTVIVNGTLTTSSGGTFNMATSQLTGTLSVITNNGTIQTQSTANPPIPSGKTWGGLIHYNNLTGSQSIVLGTYNSLTIGNTSGTSTAQGTLTVNGTFTTTAGGTLNMASNTLGGTLAVISNNGTILTQSTSTTGIPAGKTWGGTVNYNATFGGQTVASGTYATLLAGGAGSSTNTANGNLVVNTTLTTTSPGILDLSTFTLSGAFNAAANLGMIRTQNTSATPVPSGKTWGGTVNYSLSSGGQSIMDGTYNNLTLSHTSGTSTALGVLTVNGTLATSASGILNMGTNQLLGSLTSISNSGTIQTQSTANPAIPNSKTWGGTVNYNASTGGQFVAAGTYNNLTLNNTSGTSAAQGALTVNNTLTTSAGGTLNMGANLLAGVLSTISNTGTIQTQAAGATPIPTGRTWGGTVEFNGTAAQTVVTGTYNNLTLAGTRIGSPTVTFPAGTIRVNNTYSHTTTGVGTYSNAGNTFMYGATTGGQSVPGYPMVYNNVTFLNSSGTNTITGGELFVGSALTTTAGGVLDMGTNFLNGFLTTITNAGTIRTQSTTMPAIATGKNWGVSGGTIEFNRTTGGQTIPPGTYNNLMLSNTSGTTNAQGLLTVNGTLTTTVGGTLNMGTNQLAGTLSTIANSGAIETQATGATPIPTGKTWGGTLTYNGTGAQTIVAGSYGDLWLTSARGGAAITLASGTVNVSGLFSVTATGIGSYINTGNTVVYTTLTGGQSIGGAVYNNLTLNNTSGVNTLGADATVNGVLTLGKMSIGASNLTLGTAATMPGAFSSTRMIVATGTGQLRRLMTANSSFTFPVGDAANYTPATVNMTAGAYAGGAYTGVNLRTVKHPNNGNVSNHLNRYWSIGTSGITAPSYTAAATYVIGDVTGTEASMSAGSYSGSLPWARYASVSTGTHSLTTGSMTSIGSDITAISSAPPTVSSSPDVALCNGGSTTLTASSAVGDPPFTYTWAPAAGLSATTGASVTASPTVTTTYTLTVTDVNGFSGTANTTVTVNAVPTVASITPSLSTVCVGTGITFTAGATTGTGTLVSYNWSGPNGYSTTTATGSAVLTPTTTASSGEYTLTVTYPDAGCTSAQVTTSVTVNALPTVASITPSSSTLCLGTPLTLTAGAVTGTGTLTSYNWTGPDGYSNVTAVNSAAFTPSTTASGGNYSVTVTYPGAGCTSTAAVTSPSVTVNALPTITGITPSSTTLCVGTPLTLTASGASGTGSIVSYNWTGPNSYSATTASGSTVFTTTATAESGDYSVTVTYAGTGCISAAVVTAPSVTINALPTLTGISASPGTLCVGTALTLTASGASGTGTPSYNWSGPNGYTETTAVNTAVLTATTTAASGNYSVTVSYPGTGCTSAAAVTSPSVTVNALPTVAGITPSTTDICTGTSLTLTAGAVTGTGTSTYNWSGPNGYSATSATNTTSLTPATTAASGSYSLFVTYPGTGCTSSTVSSATVTVADKPTLTGVTATPATLCINDVLTLTAMGATGPGSILSYNWSGPNSYSSTTAGAVQTYTVPATTASGAYSVTVTYAGTGCTSDAAASTVVTVNPLPVIYTVTGGGEYCSGGTGVAVGLSNSEVGVNYQLYNGASVSGAPAAGTGAAISFGLQTVTGTYSVRATNPTTTCARGMSGTVNVVVLTDPAIYAVTGGGTYCEGTGGLPVGLASSDAGVNYQLYRGATAVGSLVAGTGAAISFGNQTVAGTYTVVANPGATCQKNMTGSATIVMYPTPNVYNVTGGGTYCENGSGVHIGLDFSVIGINYQLYNGATAVGTPVAGANSALDFGFQTAAGTYTVRATNASTSCTSSMTGSAVVTINPAPLAYTVTGGGTACESAGVAVGLSNSQTGMTYQLYNGATTTGSPVAGTGAAISFGNQTSSGTYTVLATNTTTFCTNAMTGSAVVNINATPTAYTVTGGGAYCTGGSGIAVGLSNSAVGISYQLYNGAATVGGAFTGTGAAINFGAQTAGGTYTVLATNTGTSCTGAMAGSAAITVNPLPTAYAVTGGGSYCAGGSGVAVGLANSQSGVNYQLYNGVVTSGTPVAGSGSAISFGAQTGAGTYTVLATNAATSCATSMTGGATVVVNPLPTAYAVTGGGAYCAGAAGVAVGLGNSEVGISYQLYNGLTATGTAVAGTGATVSFGNQTAGGTYTVLATNTTTSCTNAMSGSASVTVNATPAQFNVTGGGGYCTGGSGVAIGLDMSNTGINYQLYNGASTVGGLVAGTGAAISFGSQTAAGTYTVQAIDAITFCTRAMLGSAPVVINPLPTAYTVTGGGSYCAGGTGVQIGLTFSNSGVNYQLYNGATAVGSPVAGSGASLDFGFQTGGGTYTVLATNSTTGCSAPMTGSATVVVNPLPIAYAVTGGGAYCEGGAGSTIGMANSQAGVSYQLYNGATATGTAVAGTGAAISFGPQPAAGTYTVLATNTTTSCTNAMSGSATVTITPGPIAYAITGGGAYCTGGSGVAIGLANTSLNVTYQLYNGASAVGSGMAGTGAAISFGSQTAAGTYTVLATDNITSCTKPMTGSATVIVNPLPTAYAVTGGGSYCSGGTGVTVGLANSAVGISYRLYRGATAVGTAVAGTGAAISFGLQTASGTYTVLATNTTTSCTNAMTGSATVTALSLPAAYAVIGGGAYCAGGPGVHIGVGFSDPGVNYQLYSGATAIGSPLIGSGAGLDFGFITTAGTYSVLATSTITSCSSAMSGSATVSINPVPTAYTVTGGGAYCAGGTGVAVGLSNSAAGINYQLYNGATATGSAVAGTGAAISFGLQSAAGTYSVRATNATTTCASGMSGTSVITVNALPVVFAVTGGGSYCSGASGANVGIAGSEAGVNYQLFNGSSAVGSVVAGTGAALDFGLQTGAGTYSVSAVNATTGCISDMTGTASVVINSLPVAYSVTGGGGYCSGGTGAVIGLASSTADVNYQLYIGGSPVGGVVAGTGGAISFGSFATPATYTAIGTNATTGCVANMTGSATVTVSGLPTVYSVTGGGGYCSGAPGVNIGTSNSTTGINYQLYNGATAIGSPVAGSTGAGINFGTFTTTGTYSVMATNATTGCSAAMTGSATVSVNPSPAAFAVSGGGSYCSGGTGVVIGLTGSATGVNYQLFRGATAASAVTAGSGSALSFGFITTVGTYTVLATNAATSCTTAMTGSTVVSINALPVVYTVTGGGSYCAGGAGLPVGLSNSEAGINYQLFRSGTPVGGVVAGTGTAINFGTFAAAGVYTVSATNAVTGCASSMTGSAAININAVPTVFTVSGGGNYCAGGTGRLISLNGSTAGVNYQLYRGSATVGTPVAGTGSTLDFGSQTVAGTYTVFATNGTTSCTSNMTGSATINVDPLPTAYTVIGGGSYCSGGSGVVIALSNSTTGITYQLYLGATAVSAPVAGSGSAISFGLQTTAGTYSVLATNTATTCTAPMSGSATIIINATPAVYNVTGGGSYCTGGTGVSVGLGGSASGVNYQLYNGSTVVGATVAGTGATLSFGMQTAAGTYSVLATSASASCTADMTGTAAVSINSLPAAFTIIGGGNYCEGGTGVSIALSGSAAGVNYQLYNDATAIGTPVAGTGSGISFGFVTSVGSYSVVATGSSTGCIAPMTGSAAVGILPLPTAYTVTGGGSYCAGGAGVVIGLSGSNTGINYRLYRDATAVGGLVAGNGGAITFGIQTAAGTYTVAAVSASSGCTAGMTGSAIININATPTAYTITGGGAYCAGSGGVSVGLGGSATGVIYQLYNGASMSGASVAGTGSAISFGLQTSAGTYSVLATDGATGCTGAMLGTAPVAVNPLPVAYTVTGGGGYCTGNPAPVIGLSSSEAGVSYRLYRGATLVTTITGTGSGITFGAQSVAGTYSVQAINTASTCTNNMTGTAIISINPTPVAYDVTGGGNYCAGDAGVLVGLSNSTTGVNYQLYNGATAVGAPVAGTGSDLSFGMLTAAGTYSVAAVNATTGCTANMTGSVSVGINPLPLAYSVVGGGGYCTGGAGVVISLSGSEAGIGYQLYNGGVPVAFVAGTGGALSFGMQTGAGTYMVFAINAVTGCTTTMSGSADVTISPMPVAYTVTGGGSYCSGGTGVVVSLSGSTAGVNYQLYNGIMPVGGTVAGTGSDISFGMQTGAGSYNVVAIDATTGCTGTMSSSVLVSIDPLPTAYTLTGGGSYCTGGAGVSVGLDGSDAGINYQLFNGASAVTAPVAGTGAGIDFGVYTATGAYSVVATNATTGCVSNMTGTSVISIDPLPAAYMIGGSGTSYCEGGAGIAISLSNSTTGVSYQLLNGSVAIGSPLAGTGSALDFGFQTPAGIYTVRATNATTGCTADMAGTVSISISPLPVAYTVTGGGSYCTGGAGVPVGLANSASGITYQLYRGATAVGGTVAGTGSALSFGIQTTPGVYSVIASNNTTGCVSAMGGTVTISVSALPTVYTVTGGGNFCSGTASTIHIGLSNSATGVNYQLYNGAATVGAPVGGTGTALDFGIYNTAGTYSVAAVNTTTGCTSNMTGTATISVNPLPASYNVTGGGTYCAGGTGMHIGLANSATGVSYQLYNGGTAVGTMVAGTGAALDFGTFTATGTYSVLAINASTTCARSMTGSATITTNPLPAVFSVTGGGNYCESVGGISVGLAGSALGISYQLYNGTTTMGGPLFGTGGALDFGLQSMTGTYSVVATNSTTGCVRSMSGTASVSSTPSVIPSVTVSASTGVNICSGTAATFTATPVNGGSAPTYVWKVNGLTAGIGSTYSYLPNNGDVVRAVLTSNATCASPDTASNAVTMTVNTSFLPTVSITAAPGGTVCTGTPVTFTPASTYGGTAPVYDWYRNGTLVGTGATFSLIPADGDMVAAKMTSNYTCRLATTVSSNNITMDVTAPLVPSVSIAVNPGTSIAPGQLVTFTATGTNGGASPAYQWFVNGTPQTGATSSVYTSNSLNNHDSVTVRITSSGACGGLNSFNTVFMTVGAVGVVNVAALDMDVRVIPNPNKGTFSISGSIGTDNGQATIEVTNMLGQSVYSGKATIKNGSIEERITLDNTLANGMYMLSVRSGAHSKVFHIVIEQ
ncbi:MAG: T9SS type A sorting domain-containing protein [Bacteroidota bacterium]